MDPKSKEDEKERDRDTDPAPPPSMNPPDSKPTFPEILRRGEYAILDDDGDYD